MSLRENLHQKRKAIREGIKRQKTFFSVFKYKIIFIFYSLLNLKRKKKNIILGFKFYLIFKYILLIFINTVINYEHMYILY